MWTISIFLKDREQPVNLWFDNKAGADEQAQRLYQFAGRKEIVVIEDNYQHWMLVDTDAISAVVLSSLESEMKMQEDRMVDNHKMQQRAANRVNGGPSIMPAGGLTGQFSRN